jgi:hypothetical protein
VDDAVFFDVDFYWRKNPSFTSDVKLVHRYCKRYGSYNRLNEKNNTIVKEKSQPYKHIKRAHGGIPQKEYRTSS